MRTTSLGFNEGIPFVSLAFAASLVVASAPLPAQSPSPQLAFPVKCEVGRSCLIQKLVDHDKSAGRRDYRCGTLTTDGHDGVDIRLRTMEDMRSGYSVVASTEGTVLRIRDGEPDVGPGETTGSSGKDAGNGVVIDHGNGWETQYSHLQRGSIRVRPGEPVVAGQTLGLVGMSGNTEFPHLHFTVRHLGTPIDPFTGAGQGSACSSVNPPASLWTAEASRALSYVPTSIISIGLASSVPPRSVVSRTSERRFVGRQAPVLLWADVIGARTGDIQDFIITGPDGRPAHAQQVTVADGGLSWFAYSGKRAPEAGWSAGPYVGRYSIRRDGKTIASADTVLKME